MFFNNNCCQNMMQNECGCGPIIEQPIQKCIEKTICHKVEHD